MRISLLSKFIMGLFLSLLVVPEVYGQILFEENSALAPTDSRVRFQRGLALLSVLPFSKLDSQMRFFEEIMYTNVVRISKLSRFPMECVLSLWMILKMHRQILFVDIKHLESGYN